MKLVNESLNGLHEWASGGDNKSLIFKTSRISQFTSPSRHFLRDESYLLFPTATSPPVNRPPAPNSAKTPSDEGLSMTAIVEPTEASSDLQK